jgi:hypothetical protein
MDHHLTTVRVVVYYKLSIIIVAFVVACVVDVVSSPPLRIPSSHHTVQYIVD